ncbi:hypothetical protein CUMW_196560 [Citrus unshiu]|uniref:O-methyltransferase C-terminal domain-containing protein n=1 Tax=Citrus unshiu TaxID=55188 RepID=A0A2H5Q5Z6_CITUN|nr:hypothetical protein CUMW_196560 [Citrus unshiu]GAY59706.1 hypothetical protein CUMW_196560 [Citrus unshiu]GAY59707.1 hypothetical protein CUMW_196560 [Citrus unshiu]
MTPTQNLRRRSKTLCHATNQCLSFANGSQISYRLIILELIAKVAQVLSVPKQIASSACPQRWCFTFQPLSRESRQIVIGKLTQYLKVAIPFNMGLRGMNTITSINGKDPKIQQDFNQWNVFSCYHYHEEFLKIPKALRPQVSFDVVVEIGASLNMIISKYPIIKGINFEFTTCIFRMLSLPGIEHVAETCSSVFQGDAIFMKWICHNWSEEACVKI